MRRETTVELSENVKKSTLGVAATLRARATARPSATTLNIPIREILDLANMLERNANIVGDMAALVDNAAGAAADAHATISALMKVHGIVVPSRTFQRRAPWWRRLFT